MGVNVPHEWKFDGAKVLGTFGFRSPGMKVLSVDFLLLGPKVRGNEESRYQLYYTPAISWWQGI